MARSSADPNGPPKVRRVPALDPSGVWAHIDDDGRLRVKLPDGTEHANVRVVPAFPVTRPDRFLYLLDEYDNELGLLADPRRLDRESRDLVIAQAEEAYFLPRITRIVRVDERMGIARWQVETDRGASAFDVVSRSESVWYIGRNRIVIRDSDGNRYLIEDIKTLDRRSRKLADLHM